MGVSMKFVKSAIFLCCLSVFAASLQVLAQRPGRGRSYSPSRGPARETFKKHMKWVIGHEGCLVYDGDSVRDGGELRACYENKQRDKDEPLSLSRGASD